MGGAGGILKKIGIIAVLVLMAAAAFFKFALMGYSFIAYALTAAAAVIVAYILLDVLKSRKPGVSKVLKTIFTYALILGLLALAVTEAALIGETKRSKDASADYAIVFGAGVNGTVPSRSLRARLVAALEYAEKYPETKIIVSGAKGTGEDITEAECMKNWLTARGVTPERIAEENRAATSYENVKFSYDMILSEEPDFDGTVCLITEGYHVLRTKLIAKDFGLDTRTYSGSTGMPVLTANYYLREAFAIWYYLVFG